MIYKLTKKDKNTIRLYNLGLTVDKLAKHFKISKFAVYKRLRKLHKNSQIKKIGKYWGVPSPGIGKSDEFRKPIRLHALQYEVRILSTSKTYKEILKKSNILDFQDYKCNLHEKSISIFILKEFITKYPNESYFKSLNYLRSCLSKLEIRLNILLLKSGYCNIKEVKSHYSEANNELAKDYNKKNKKLSCRGLDGIEWLKVDYSLKIHELEFVHPKSARSDANTILDHFEFLRKNPRVIELLSRDVLLLNKLVLKNKKV